MVPFRAFSGWSTGWQSGVRMVTLLIACGLGGCLEMQQTLTLMPDGGLTFGLRYSFPQDALPHLAAAQQAIEGWQGGDPKTEPSDLHWIFNRTLAKTFFSRDGLELTAYDQAVKDGRAVVALSGRAADGPKALRSDRLGRISLTPDAAGNMTLALELADENPAGDPLDADQRQQLQQLCAGLKIALTIQCPGDIVETTGRRVNARETRWEFDADKDPGFLAETPAIRVTFKPPQAWHGEK